MTFSLNEHRVFVPWIDHPEAYRARLQVTHSDVSCTLDQDRITISGSGGSCLIYVDSNLPWQTYDEALYAMAMHLAPANVSYIIPCHSTPEPIPWVTVRAGPSAVQRTMTSGLSHSSLAAIDVECRAANASQYALELQRAFERVDVIHPASGQPVPYVMDRIDWHAVRPGSTVKAHLVAASDASISEWVDIHVKDRLAPELPRLPAQPGIVPERVQCLGEATTLGAHLGRYAQRVFSTSPGDACDGTDISYDFSWSVHPSPGECSHRALVRYQWAVTDQSGNRNAGHLQVIVQDTRSPQWTGGVSMCLIAPKTKDGIACVPDAWTERLRAVLFDECTPSSKLAWTLTPRRRRICKSLSSCVEMSASEWISDTCTSTPWFAFNGDFVDLEWLVVPRDECGNRGAAQSVRVVVAQHAAQCQRMNL